MICFIWFNNVTVNSSLMKNKRTVIEMTMQRSATMILQESIRIESGMSGEISFHNIVSFLSNVYD